MNKCFPIKSLRLAGAFWCRVNSFLFQVVIGLTLVYNASSQMSSPLERVANTTLRMPQIPQSWGYKTVPAFGAVTFDNPVALRTLSGDTNRLFVVEQGGKVFAITNLALPTKTLYLDLSKRVQFGQDTGLFAVAFHPGFQTNGFLFVGYHLTTQTADGTGLHFRVSRFSVSPENPNSVVTNSELALITQHISQSGIGFATCNDFQFGPEGYLYIAIGNSGDPGTSAQAIDANFYGGILRIDVDKNIGNLIPNSHPAVTTNYAIPSDNPFVGATNFNGAPVNPLKVRTEYYAVGLRNPWRMAFDPPTGLLYVGDPGTTVRDEIDIIVKGGNYGWPYREGIRPGPKASKAPPGFSSINPIYEASAGAVIGGVVYRGDTYSQLEGEYIFGDWVTGQLSGLRFAGTNLLPAQKLTTQSGIVAFGFDPGNGDVLAVNHEGGRIMRLIYSTNLVGKPLPPTLADTGAFADLKTLTPQSGIVPYVLNVPFWSDNAHKTRWFCLPELSQTMVPSVAGHWSFPTGMVWIKHFELEMTNGLPESARRLETRLIVRNSDGVYGVTYRWGDSLTNATLVPANGMDEEFEIDDGGVKRTQTWHYPSRAECLICHTPLAGHALGFNTQQLNRNSDFGGASENQIRALNEAGYFQTKLSGLHTLPALAHATNSAASLDYRVHSYLAANCAQCHQPGGIGRGSFDARITTPLSAAGIIDGSLLNDLGDSQNRLIKPGSLEKSVLFSRLANLGERHMPPLATSVLNSEALSLLSGWITNGLIGYQNFADWQIAAFGSTNAPNSTRDADTDHDGAVNQLEYLTGTNPLLPGDGWGIGIARNETQVEIHVPQIANRAFQIQWTLTPSDPSSWQPLDVSGNEPLFSATAFDAKVQDTLTNAPSKFYRARILEP